MCVSVLVFSSVVLFPSRMPGVVSCTDGWMDGWVTNVWVWVGAQHTTHTHRGGSCARPRPRGAAPPPVH